MLRRLRRRTSTVTDLSKNSRYPSLAGAVLFPILLLIIWTQKTNHKLFHCVLDPTFTGVFSFSLSLGIPYGASQGAGHIQEEFGGAERRQKGAVQHPTRPLTLRGMLSSYKKSSTWISVKWAVSWIQHKSSSLLLLTWREARPPKNVIGSTNAVDFIFFCRNRGYEIAFENWPNQHVLSTSQVYFCWTRGGEVTLYSTCFQRLKSRCGGSLYARIVTKMDSHTSRRTI